MSKPLNVAITGASGYLGSALCRLLLDRGHRPIALTWRKPVPGVMNRRINDPNDVDELADAIVDCDAVVHLAAISHRLEQLTDTGIEKIRRINVGITEALGRAAIKSRVSRFVFVSSIKVNGERTNGRPFTVDDAPQPEDIYGQTKFEAEQKLRSLRYEGDFRPVIIRPPLIYGGATKGNLALLLGAVSKGVPLPLAGIDNRRSMVSLPLICEFIEVCLTHPDAPGHTFLVSDGIPRSTPEIVRMLSAERGYSARLFYCPRWLLSWAGRLLGKLDMTSRLTNDLVVDTDATRKILGWDPNGRNTESDR